jgi:hypothetical protein
VAIAIAAPTRVAWRYPGERITIASLTRLPTTARRSSGRGASTPSRTCCATVPASVSRFAAIRQTERLTCWVRAGTTTSARPAIHSRRTSSVARASRSSRTSLLAGAVPPASIVAASVRARAASAATTARHSAGHAAGGGLFRSSASSERSATAWSIARRSASSRRSRRS